MNQEVSVCNTYRDLHRLTRGPGHGYVRQVKGKLNTFSDTSRAWHATSLDHKSGGRTVRRAEGVWIPTEPHYSTGLTEEVNPDGTESI